MRGALQDIVTLKQCSMFLRLPLHGHERQGALIYEHISEHPVFLMAAAGALFGDGPGSRPPRGEKPLQP